jgi:hypothetical protein
MDAFVMSSPLSHQTSNQMITGLGEEKNPKRQENARIHQGASTNWSNIADGLMTNSSSVDETGFLVTGHELLAQTVAVSNSSNNSNSLVGELSDSDNQLVGELKDPLLAKNSLQPTQVQDKLVFIDPTVEDYSSLIAGISPNAKVSILDPSKDGIEQITKELSNNQKISSLEIISHGAPGQLLLGQTSLDTSTLNQYSQYLQSWAESLTSDADIFLYGCNIAEGEQGKDFVRKLSHLTKADIAASTDLTGTAAQGGDWDLEMTTGKINTASALQPEQLQTYKATLDNLSFPEGFMKRIEDYGAKPNDGIDDTAAIQKALDDGRRDADGNPLHSDFNGRPKTLYFSAGVYNVSDTLDWIGSNVTLQGQGSDATVIQLKNSASGFSNPAAPKAVIKTPEGNASFRQNIWNLSVNTGENNSGAIGVDYISSNVGAMRDVKITSKDGRGFAGLAMDRKWPGPSLIKNVQIEGFDYGIRVTPAEYGPTFENITLKNQRVAGINNVYGALSIRGLDSTNKVPVIKGTHSAGMITLLDANLQGGSSSVSAIESQGQLYLRNINTDGYQSAVKYKGNVVAGTTQTEYSSNVYQVFDSPERSLNLPIQETPEFHDNNMENWGRFQPKWYGETGGLQPLLDSGKSTIYFKSDRYYSFNETVVKVPASVKRIVGFSSVVNQDSRGINGGGIKFVVAENSSDPLIIEGFGYGVKVEHQSSRPVALKHGGYQYTSGTKPGNLFLEDVNVEPLRIKPGQKVWARQFNNEHGSHGSKIINNGGDLWVMGLKTERAGTVINSLNGAETELLGGVILPTYRLSDEEKKKPAFLNTDSRTSLVYRDIAHDPAYDYVIQVKETRDGQTRQMLTSEMPRQVPLFTAYKA